MKKVVLKKSIESKACVKNYEIIFVKIKELYIQQPTRTKQDTEANLQLSNNEKKQKGK